MLIWLIHILIDSVVLLIVASIYPRVELRGYKTALVVAFLIGILSFFLGWLFTTILNLLTLGILFFLGLGFITRVIAFALIIEIADKFSKNFRTHGFTPSLVLAVILAAVGVIVDMIIL